MRVDEKRTERILDILRDKQNLECCTTYGEPGYQDPEKGILLCDWNPISKGIQKYLEEAGYELEWCDEWTIDYDYSKAYRTSPDCYQWESQIRYTDDGEMLTPDDSTEDWIEYARIGSERDVPRLLPTRFTHAVLAEQGYVQFMDDCEGKFETGFHTGQNDDPVATARKIFGTIKNVDWVVFRLSENSQFYTVWEAWYTLKDMADVDHADECSQGETT